jgi:hypothetical protein
MSEAAGADAPGGFLATLAGVLVTPGTTLRAIVRQPSFWAPLLAFVAASAAFNAVWLRELDPAEFARVQIEDSPLVERLSPEQRAKGIEQEARLFPFRAWLGPLVGWPATLVLVAAVYLFVFRFFYGGDVTFRQSLSIVSWTFLAWALVTLPLTLLVLYLTEDWNVEPGTALQANFTLFLDKASVPRAVYALAESIDLISAWMLALLSVGYGAAIGRRPGQAAVGVAALWALYVLGKAALSAVF